MEDPNLLRVDHYKITQNIMCTLFRDNIWFMISWWVLWMHKTQQNDSQLASSGFSEVAKGTFILSQWPSVLWQRAAFSGRLASSKAWEFRANKVQKEKKTWVFLPKGTEWERNMRGDYKHLLPIYVTFTFQFNTLHHKIDKGTEVQKNFVLRRRIKKKDVYHKM